MMVGWLTVQVAFAVILMLHTSEVTIHFAPAPTASAPRHGHSSYPAATRSTPPNTVETNTRLYR
jgi:hypothetical protein